uniref:Uncharacterized protein n=1 Tax=Anguilla anguilla TaxID=7936 RepID=A0A0E9W2V4_ANGAN
MLCSWDMISFFCSKCHRLHTGM